MLESFFYILNQFESRLIILLQKYLSNSFLDQFFLIYTDLHKKWPFQIFLLMLFLFWFYKEKWKAFRRFFGLILNLVIIDSVCGLLIKKLVERPRPFVTFIEILQKSPASGYSFVSNHAANMMGIAAYLSCFYPRWKVFWWTLALLVAFSRVYNGVHYFSDVIIGGLIGACIGTIMAKIVQYQWERIKE